MEEINLSPPEGYLSPVVHGLSGIDTPALEWHLHSKRAGAETETSTLTVPETALLGPFPRVLGTINVDANAPAPARKVAARSCVVLLEPEKLSADGLGETVEATLSDTSHASHGSATEFLGNPLDALDDLDEQEFKQAVAALLAVFEAANTETVSRRDGLRCLTYMAYFVRLAGKAGASVNVFKLAAENAYLHCVLPVLDADHFVAALEALIEGELVPEAKSAQALGGNLQPRVVRLNEIVKASGFGFAEAVDFWSALS